MSNMKASVFSNKLKTALIVALITALLYLVVYFIAYAMGWGEYAIVIAGVISIMSSVFSYWNSDKMVIKMSGAHEATGDDLRILQSTVAPLADRAGVPMPKLYVVEDSSPNAFATGRNPSHSAIAATRGLLNMMTSDELSGVLAHEMGHAMHSYLSTKNQEPVDREYVIFVAEVASTCNESLLMQHLLKKTQDKKTRAYLINYFLEQFRTTLYRQTMFAEFELKINELVQNGGSLTAEGLNKIYHDLNVFYYGDAVVVDDLIDREWARIPHFYYNYYVFQYSTGFSAAMALSERILSEGEPAVKDYLNFLSGGCSKDPISLLQGAGVDMRTAEPVHRALKLFDSLLDEMEALMEA